METQPQTGELLTAFELEKERVKNIVVDKLILEKIEEKRKQ
jgi:hypothetical protein